jgi:hypothetical protein
MVMVMVMVMVSLLASFLPSVLPPLVYSSSTNGYVFMAFTPSPLISIVLFGLAANSVCNSM